VDLELEVEIWSASGGGAMLARGTKDRFARRRTNKTQFVVRPFVFLRPD